MTQTANETTKQIKNYIRQPYAFPGGYPQFLVMTDGSCLCHKCAKTNANLIIEQTRRPQSNTGWAAVGTDVNWESQLNCDECGDVIESAYSDEV
jgi:hypothetical protein